MKPSKPIPERGWATIEVDLTGHTGFWPYRSMIGLFLIRFGTWLLRMGMTMKGEDAAFSRMRTVLRTKPRRRRTPRKMGSWQ